MEDVGSGEAEGTGHFPMVLDVAVLDFPSGEGVVPPADELVNTGHHISFC